MGVHVLEAHGGSTAYFATWSRAGEFAVGGLVACSMNLLPLVRHRVLRIGDIQDVPPLTFGQRIGLELGVGLYLFVAVGCCIIPLPVETLIWHCFHWFRLPLLSAILGFGVCSNVQLSEPLPRWAIFTNILPQRLFSLGKPLMAFILFTGPLSAGLEILPRVFEI